MQALRLRGRWGLAAEDTQRNLCTVRISDPFKFRKFNGPSRSQGGCAEVAPQLGTKLGPSTGSPSSVPPSTLKSPRVTVGKLVSMYRPS